MPFCNITLLNTAPLCNPNLFDFWYDKMSESRKRKIDCLKFDSDKRLSLGAGILLYKATRKAGLEELETVPDTNGKPQFKNHPSFHFNLSHSGSFALCAVSDYPVGCDIEKIEEARFNIAQRFFHPSELKALEECSNTEDKTRLFFKIWTQKESFAKASGAGLKMEFESFDSTAGQYYTRSFFQDGYVFSICIPNCAENVRLNIEKVIPSVGYAD